MEKAINLVMLIINSFVILAIMILFITFYEIKNVPFCKEVAKEYPAIFVTGIEYIPEFGYSDKWCLHYAINGEMLSAFFDDFNKVNEYIEYLTVVSGNNLRRGK